MDFSGSERQIFVKNAQKRDFLKLLKKKSVFDQQINCIYKYEDLVTQPTLDLFHDLLPPIRKTLLRITQQLPPLPSAARRRRWWSPGLSQQGRRRSRDGGAGKAEQQQQQLRDERREEASRRGAACQRDAIDLTPTEIDSRTGARGTGEGGGWWGSLTRHTHLNSKRCTGGGGGGETHFSPTRRHDITEAQTTDGREKSSAGKLKRLRSSSSSSNTG